MVSCVEGASDPLHAAGGCYYGIVGDCVVGGVVEIVGPVVYFFGPGFYGFCPFSVGFEVCDAVWGEDSHDFGEGNGAEVV